MKENHSRSVAKGVSWRIVGTLDTIALSFLFTRSASTALKIGLAEIASKIILFYLHERAWLKLGFWRKKTMHKDGSARIHDHHKRSVAKGISWRILGTLDTMLWVAVITRSSLITLSIGFTELFTKILLYYLHERAWLRIKWGYKKG